MPLGRLLILAVNRCWWQALSGTRYRWWHLPYCYHHEGKELNNDLMPGPELLVLGPEEGTALTAEYMLPVMESMASIFAEPDNNTLRLKYEELTESLGGL